MIIVVCATVLCAASLTGWFVAAAARASVRIHLRFACVMFAAVAAACAIMADLGNEVALIAGGTAVPVLALAALAASERPTRPGPAAFILMLSCLAGLASAATGFTSLSLAPMTLAAFAVFIVSARRFSPERKSSLQGMASALAFVAAALSFALEGAKPGYLLFASAGLLGLTLALSHRQTLSLKNMAGDRIAGPLR